MYQCLDIKLEQENKIGYFHKKSPMRPTNIKKVAPKCCTLKATDQCGGIRVTLRSYPRAIQSLSREVKAAHIDRVSGQSGNGGPELELSNRSDLVETKTS